MTKPLGVGVVGCGIIAKRYVGDAAAFSGWRPVACSDLDEAAAEAFASEHGLRAETFDELLDDPTIELVVCAGIPSERGPLAIRAMRAGPRKANMAPVVKEPAASTAMLMPSTSSATLWRRRPRLRKLFLLQPCHISPRPRYMRMCTRERPSASCTA